MFGILIFRNNFTKCSNDPFVRNSISLHKKKGGEGDQGDEEMEKKSV